MFNWLTKLGGDASEREIKKLRPLVDQINSLEADYKALSDAARTTLTVLLKFQTDVEKVAGHLQIPPRPSDN